MAQIKIYGLSAQLAPIRKQLSDVVHGCVVEALGLPVDKRFHRFIGLEAEDFIYPPGRSERYLILEISMFEGRSVEAKKQLIRLLFERVLAELGIQPEDLEITITETPRHNWGIRGVPGDELGLSYKVSV
jgi:phenylpyruvate tautomerase PptA (4-oxalocrotonate tautomerase family)